MRPEFEPDDKSSRSLPEFTTRNYDAHDNEAIEVTEAELEALKDEVEVLHGGDTVEAANQLLISKTMQAIMSISKLATDATAERVRLDASRYIVERVLGPLTKIQIGMDFKSDPIAKFMIKAGMIVEDTPAEAQAKINGSITKLESE